MAYAKRSDGSDGLTPAQRWRKRHPGAEKARRVRVRDRRNLLLASMKAKPCADCGVEYPPCVMQFDHLDPATKAFNIGGKYRHAAIPKLMAEAAKCDVVCANCHSLRTESQDMLLASRMP